MSLLFVRVDLKFEWHWNQDYLFCMKLGKHPLQVWQIIVLKLNLVSIHLYLSVNLLILLLSSSGYRQHCLDFIRCRQSGTQCRICFVSLLCPNFDLIFNLWILNIENYSTILFLFDQTRTWNRSIRMTKAMSPNRVKKWSPFSQNFQQQQQQQQHQQQQP